MNQKKKTKREILKTIGKEMPFLKDEYGVSRCGLFGSYARGDAEAASDVDLLVQFERPIGLFKFMLLEHYLSEKLGIKVDLVTEDALKPLIKPSVMEAIIYV